MLGGQTVVEALAEIRDTLCGTNDAEKTGVRNGVDRLAGRHDRPDRQAAKHKLRAKFGYAKDLDDSGILRCDPDGGADHLPDAQEPRRLPAAAAHRRRAGYLHKCAGHDPPPAPRVNGTLFTVQGTGVDMWTGYPADCARALVDTWRWQPIGNYPAAVFPMGPWWTKGRAELRLQIQRHPGEFAMFGYSQGAIVTSMVFKHDILNPNGVLHHRLPDIVAAVTFGNPCRELGHTWPGDPNRPTGRGISNDRLDNTPEWWWDFAQTDSFRDIYTNVPDDDAGEDMTAIFRLVQNLTGLFGTDGLLEQISEITARPVDEVWDMFKAIYYGGQFIAHQPATLPHISYDIRPAVDYLRRAAVAVPAAA